MMQGVFVLALLLGDPALAQRAPGPLPPEFFRTERVSRDPQTLAADAEITERVRAALVADGAPLRSIAVETVGGRVHLSGFVGSPELVSRAGRVTRGVNGVRTVSNNIAVR